MSELKRKKKVTVFGAGVTGLTAAHELAERGFQVEVIDPAIREEVHARTFDRGIGGMARSQFACRKRGIPDIAPTDGSTPAIPQLRSSREFLVDDVIAFKVDDLSTPRVKAIADDVLERLARLLRLFAASKVDASQIQMLVFRRDNPSPSKISLSSVSSASGVPGERAEQRKQNPLEPDGADDERTAPKLAEDPRVLHIKNELELRLADSKDKETLTTIAKIVVRATSPEDHERPQYAIEYEDMVTWVMFSVVGLEIFPAEHGFRFFPSFYRHLFDTMSRIRILNPRAHERALKTAKDNLLPSEGLGFAAAKKAASFVVPRGRIASAEVMRKYLRLVLSELGYTLADIELFGKKLFKYMTSSTERRRTQYEDTSWGEFVEQWRYSDLSKKHIEFGPQMSAALRGSESDARTQGNITIQLMLDQVIANSQPDSTLNGPTNSAWFDHWADYLLRQGVKFRRGELIGFEAHPNTSDPTIRPILKGQKQRDAEGDAAIAPAEGDAFVLALSLSEMAKLAPKFEEAASELDPQWPSENDFGKVARFAGTDLDTALMLDKPPAPLQHLSGIQFYFDVEVQFWRGHTQYLDSEWGLTSIAQPQFWGRQRDTSDGYRSILSVDIGIWDRKYKGRTAWECSADDIAQFAWEQIQDHHDEAIKQRQGRGAKVPRPIGYYLDANIVFKDKTAKEDKTPFLVNKTREFNTRPGCLLPEYVERLNPRRTGVRSKLVPEPGTTPQQATYDVTFNYVMSGTFMKTYTRLTSMEGANESARHAVNALLTKLEVACDRCEIWDPEANELPDMQWLKDLDQRLVENGRPHLFDIVGSDDNPALRAAALGLGIGR